MDAIRNFQILSEFACGGADKLLKKLNTFVVGLISAILIVTAVLLKAPAIVPVLFMLAVTIFMLAVYKSFEPMAIPVILSEIFMLIIMLSKLLFAAGRQIPSLNMVDSDILLAGLLWFLPFLFYTVIRMGLPCKSKLNKTYFGFFKKISICFFVMYTIFFVLVFFVFRNMNIYSKYSQHDVNLTLFKTISLMLGVDNKEYMLKNLIGNILFFVPPGFYLAIAFKKKRFLTALLLATAFSCTIEILQYVFDTGTADIDDVMLNVTGFLIGFLLKHTLDFLRSLITRKKEISIFMKSEKQ